MVAIERSRRGRAKKAARLSGPDEAARRAFDRKLEEMKNKVIDKEKRRLEAEMRLGRPMRPKRKPTTMTKGRMAEIEKEKRRGRQRRAFKTREEMITALNRRAANIVRRTNILQDDDVVAERERLEVVQKLQAAMKARVAVAREVEAKRRATEAKEKEKQRRQEVRMKKLAAQGLGNRDKDGHLLWDPVPLVGVTATPSGVTNPASSKVRRPPLTRGAQQKETERVLLYAAWYKGAIQPRIYTVYINRPFTGLTSSREMAVEGLKRWPAFAFDQDRRVQPLPQPHLLGDNTSTFYFTNQAQKVNVVENLKAIVANHMLDPRTVPPPLRPFIGTGLPK
jgi:hypothetical protein